MKQAKIKTSKFFVLKKMISFVNGRKHYPPYLNGKGVLTFDVVHLPGGHWATKEYIAAGLITDDRPLWWKGRLRSALDARANPNRTIAL